jgi:hypothetical protein
MTRTLRISIAVLLVCVYSVVSIRLADAQSIGGPIVSKSDIVLIFVAVAAVGAAIGVGVYFAVRQPPSITGCVVSGSGGLTLQNESDHQTFLLMGDTGAVKPGDRVRVKGKKKKDSAGNRSFLVDQVKKDYGACPVSTP